MMWKLWRVLQETLSSSRNKWYISTWSGHILKWDNVRIHSLGDVVRHASNPSTNSIHMKIHIFSCVYFVGEPSLDFPKYMDCIVKPDVKFPPIRSLHWTLKIGKANPEMKRDEAYKPRSLSGVAAKNRCWESSKIREVILLMAEIRLTSWYGRYPIIYRVFIHLRWCRISSINGTSIFGISADLPYLAPMLHCTMGCLDRWFIRGCSKM